MSQALVLDWVPAGIPAYAGLIILILMLRRQLRFEKWLPAVVGSRVRHYRQQWPWQLRLKTDWMKHCWNKLKVNSIFFFFDTDWNFIDIYKYRSCVVMGSAGILEFASLTGSVSKKIKLWHLPNQSKNLSLSNIFLCWQGCFFVLSRYTEMMTKTKWFPNEIRKICNPLFHIL